MLLFAQRQEYRGHNQRLLSVPQVPVVPKVFVKLPRLVDEFLKLQFFWRLLLKNFLPVVLLNLRRRKILERLNFPEFLHPALVNKIRLQCVVSGVSRTPKRKNLGVCPVSENLPRIPHRTVHCVIPRGLHSLRDRTVRIPQAQFVPVGFVLNHQDVFTRNSNEVGFSCLAGLTL